jgi:hypothetical protein
MLKLEREESRLVGSQPTKVRTYKNTLTGSEVSTYLLRVDKFNNQWWTFEDLFALPFIRQLAAKKVLDLYGHGLALDDVKSITAQLKTILRSDSGERYEQAYAKVMELDNLAETMADPVKQCMGLCTVYLLLNDEPPDAWTNQVTSQKMTALSLDIESQSFFLNWWTDIMRRSGQVLKGLSQIASTASELSANSTAAPSN